VSRSIWNALEVTATYSKNKSQQTDGPNPNGTNLSPNGALSHSPGQAPAPPWVLVLAPFGPNPYACGTSVMPPADPVSRAGATPEASRDRSSGAFCQVIEALGNLCQNLYYRDDDSELPCGPES
jgi:hypothetical protein